MKVHFASGVERDFLAIFDWIAADDPDRAASFVEELRERSFGIGSMPRGYPVVHRRGRSDIRKRSHRGYAIRYRIGIDVTNLRVVDAARDYSSFI